MGLSTEERYNNIVSIVNELKNIESFTEHDLKPFNKVLKNLWFYLLGNTNNSAHWILGSNSSASTITGMSLFGTTMIHARDNIEPHDDILDNAPADVKKYFEYRDNFIPNAIKLLESYNTKEKSNVFKIFRLSESYFYLVNRYDDNFSKQLIPLTKKICELQGLCYNEMQDKENYIKAWMMECLLDKIIDYDESNIVNQWCMNNNMHHNFGLHKIEYKNLYLLFQELQFKNTLSSEKRLLAILLMIGKSFHYKHDHEELFKLINKHNIENVKDKINLSKIKKTCDNSIKLKEKYDIEQKKESFKYCHLTRQTNK